MSPSNSLSSFRSDSARQALQKIKGSIPAITDKMPSQLSRAKERVTAVRAWRNNLDQNTYRRTKQASDAMEDAYRKYKADTEAVRLARREFNEMKAAILRPATTEGYIELAKLALSWGRKTVRSSESRLKFLRTYRQAYAFEDVRGHIMRANEFLASATSAVEEAQKWYDMIWHVQLRHPANSGPHGSGRPKQQALGAPLKVKVGYESEAFRLRRTNPDVFRDVHIGN
ncbi:uncharacterized protein K489DRAFT_410240 [Dissoconium aciculare CBS 342.82]|uniref:Uncharacterized protein n=1 Tax=Dissoconium aciculare CBS 342.82 TaxID=1314786 RepID=A0A6J3M561_9PEZI|nr:uncharacterized protein K489DRAFT_410240 [Dissoconium aciculare CBS 342.82]KAF1823185.1 hypothetical protein K489DRAFT_410240 [Dissoconium aciculare CBS 342.82]